MKYIKTLTFFSLILCTASPLLAQTISISSICFFTCDVDAPQVMYTAPKDSQTPEELALPHWKHNSSKRVPAVVTSGKKVKACLEVKISGTGSFVSIDGKSDLLNFSLNQIPLPAFSNENGHSAKTNDDNQERTIEVVLESDENLPASVGKLETSIVWTTGSSYSSEKYVQDTPVTFLSTLRRPIVKTVLFSELVEFACTYASGLSDEKEICDALIENLFRTKMRYGEDGWTTFDILKNRGGMCGGWSRLFQDLCGTLGIQLSSWFFTLRNHKNHIVEKRWMALDILQGGLNNEKPTWTDKVAFIENVYPMARYYSNDSPDDDVDFNRNQDVYRFSTVSDGHCVTFLNYGGRQYMYDPSFGKGPYSGFFSGEIPEDTDMSGDSLRVFRTTYLNKAVGHLQGRLLCVRTNGEKKMIVSPKTTLIPDHELCVYWTCLDTEKNGNGPARNYSSKDRGKTFKALYSISEPAEQPLGEFIDIPIDFGATLSAIENAESLSKTDKSLFHRILTRQIPFNTVRGTHLPGILPPLETLQRAIIIHLHRSGDRSFDTEIDRLRESSKGYYKKLITNL